MPAEPLVLTETEGRNTLLTLNRPGVRNAVNGDLLTALRAAMADADADSSTDVIVLTGADPAFCAGLDLNAIAEGDPVLAAALLGHGEPWAKTAKPVIGAANGAAVTGGLEILLHCDFLIASDRATFADTHARVGVLPTWGLSVRLPEAVGFRTALRMSLTAAPLDAHEAYLAGLVTEVVPHDQLQAGALAVGADISRADQVAVRALLSSYREGEAALWEPMYATEDRSARRWSESNLDLAETGRRRARVVADGRCAHARSREDFQG